MLVSKSLPSAQGLNVFTEEDGNRLYRRKGGGGKGGGGKGGKSGSSSKSPGARASSAAKSHGASDSFVKSRGGEKTFTVTGTSSPAYAYSNGGGKTTVLSSTSAFGGRQAGGASRSTIYGNSHFGSGYPYGSYGSYVSYRPFPYYFYPVPVSYNYYGGDEYLSVYDTERPGGNLITAIVQPSYNTSSVTYRLVGDNSSVIAVFDAIVVNCSVANSSAFSAFQPSSTTWPLPEQIVQYYRASSFALSLDGYNNTATLLANAPSSNDSTPVQMADTPLPSGLNMTFLECLNSTIGASVPLAEVPSGKKLSYTEISGIVAGSIVGFILIIWIGVCCKRRGRRYRENREKKLKEKAGLRIAPSIRVIDPSNAKSPPPDKDFFNKGREFNSRPGSVDERTLTAEPFGRKDRWSYASSSASSMTHVNDSHDLGKAEEQTGHSDLPNPEGNDSLWQSKIPFAGRFGYRAVKHQSTSSIDVPLTDPHHARSLEMGGERSEGAYLSPAYSPSPSRSPSPSPTTPRFPLMHGEEKRSSD